MFKSSKIEKLEYITTQTPVGTFTMILDGEIVVASGFDKPDSLLENILGYSSRRQFIPAKNDLGYVKLINDYFKGDLAALAKIPYHQINTVFYQEVWKTMAKVKPGKTLSYKAVAEAINNPFAMRAVGSACKHNKICLLIPCHRIIKSDGGLGNYYYGPKIKKYLLEHELKYS